MLKLYGQSVLWIAFLIANCCAIQWAFAGMNFKSDITFFLGLAGLILLVLTDGLVLARVCTKFLPKERSL
jgi:hypothetical protein